MSADADRLYRLLPIVLRERDQENGYPLRALLRIVTGQADDLRADMWQLYADHFIETCQPWVIPYIGDLVGNDLVYDGMRAAADDTAARLFRDLTGPDLRPAIEVQSRTDVANTIRNRRRKGTLSVLESLARDVTGWTARAVESRELLGATQHLAHRRQRGGWADLRDPAEAALAGGPFDVLAHTVGIRAAPGVAIPTLGGVYLFLWRLQAYPVADVEARRSGPAWRRHVSPLGARAPLFRPARTEAAGDGPVTAADVPAPLGRDGLCRDRDASRAPALSVRVNGVHVTSDQIECAALDPWPDERPDDLTVVVDAEAGRLAVGRGWGDVDGVDVDYVAGFPGNLGGGPYARRPWLIARPAEGSSATRLRLTVRDGQPVVPADGSPQAQFGSVVAALDAWARAGRPAAVVSVLDSRTYALPQRLRLRRTGELAIEAADGRRPVLVTHRDGLLLEVDASPREVETEAALTLSGVALEGHLVLAGALRRLRLLHATLAPGRGFDEAGDPLPAAPSLSVRRGLPARSSRRLRVEAAFSVTGTLHVPADAEGVWLLDSIVDGCGGEALAGAGRGGRDAAPAWLERTTVLGETFVRELSATDCVFTGAVHADRTQHGCVRFSHVPAGSRTPPRFGCQPDLAMAEAVERALAADPHLAPERRESLRRLAAARVAPTFTSRRYGGPAYGQLSAGGPPEILTGAEDGAEMGAFCFLKQAQRRGNLETRLAEYLPFGLEPHVIEVT